MPSPSRIYGPVGYGSMLMPAPPVTEPSLRELKEKVLLKLEEKCGVRSMRWRLQHAFLAVDMDGDGHVSLAEWVRVVETLGCALNLREAARMFLFYDTADGSRQRSGLISQAVVMADLLALAKGAEQSPFAKHGALELGPVPGSRSRGNLPSVQGGLFAGGAYEDEWTAKPSWNNPDACAARPSVPSTADFPIRARGGNASNVSSLEGGIFAPPDSSAPPTRQRTGPRSNEPSVPGGIFSAIAEDTHRAPRSNISSNISSMPGGLFAPSTAYVRLGGPGVVMGA